MPRNKWDKTAQFNYQLLEDRGEIDLRTYISDKMMWSVIPKAIKTVINWLCRSEVFYLEGFFIKRRPITINNLDTGTPNDDNKGLGTCIQNGQNCDISGKHVQKIPENVTYPENNLIESDKDLTNLLENCEKITKINEIQPKKERIPENRNDYFTEKELQEDDLI